MPRKPPKQRDPQPVVGDLDADQTLAAAEAGVRARRAAEVEQLELVAHWADLHAADPRRGPDPAPPFGNRLIRVGGTGTPEVQEFCLAELAVATKVSVLRMHSTTADVLDLRHRLPRLWSLTQQLQIEPWLARRVATLTRDLGSEAAAWVDEAVARVAADLPPGRVIALVEAKIIEADPEAHEAKVKAARERRYVSLGRTDEAGLRLVIARISAGDAVWIDATVDRVADILAPRYPEDTTRDVLRSEAFGWLARPAELLELLLSANQEGQPPTDEPDDEPSDRPADEPAQPPAEEPTDEPAGEDAGSRATTLSAAAIEALRGLDPTKLRPRAVVYLHLHEAALAGLCSGVARVEGLGPMGLQQLADLLQHAHVTCQPVIDLADHLAVDSYEVPEPIAERVRLTTPVDYFPHATAGSRRTDMDHPVPFDPHGPPGQTGTHNLGPLGRRHHRLKTFAGYQSRQLGPGCYLWRTPHGRYLITDHAGTHTIDPTDGEQLLHTY